MKPLQTIWTWMKQFFKYIENLWLGVDNKISLKAVLAIVFSVNFIQNFSYGTTKWAEGRSVDSLSTPLMVEAGLIAALLGITAYSNMAAQKIESQAANPAPSPIVVQKAETITADHIDVANAKSVKVDVPENG